MQYARVQVAALGRAYEAKEASVVATIVGEVDGEREAHVRRVAYARRPALDLAEYVALVEVEQDDVGAELGLVRAWL